jgi:hypothetical protein
LREFTQDAKWFLALLEAVIVSPGDFGEEFLQRDEGNLIRIVRLNVFADLLPFITWNGFICHVDADVRVEEELRTGEGSLWIYARVSQRRLCSSFLH